MSRKKKVKQPEVEVKQEEKVASAQQDDTATVISPPQTDVCLTIRNYSGAVVVNLSKNDVYYEGDITNAGAARTFYADLICEGKSLFAWLEFLRSENAALTEKILKLQSKTQGTETTAQASSGEE